jgi:hypothetical protein
MLKIESGIFVTKNSNSYFKNRLKVSENAISSIFQLCDGDMRKIVNML